VSVGDAPTYEPQVCALYGDTTTFLAEQWFTQAPPRGYLRIFDPLPIGKMRSTFANHLLASTTVTDNPELRTTLAQFVRDVQTAKKQQSRTWLQTYGLKVENPGEREYKEALRIFLRPNYPGVANRLIIRSEYAEQFPPDRLEELRQRLPETVDRWTPSQAFEAVLATKSFRGSHVNLNQMRNSQEWIAGPVLEAAAENLLELLPRTGKIQFERLSKIAFQRPVVYDKGFRKCAGIEGLLDAVDIETKTVYEFKFSIHPLLETHKKQLLIYLHLLVSSGVGGVGPVRGVLFNSNTQEEWRAELPNDPDASSTYLCRLVQTTLRTVTCPVR